MALHIGSCSTEILINNGTPAKAGLSVFPAVKLFALQKRFAGSEGMDPYALLGH